jgi:methionyl aminopeptidase
MQVMSVDLKTPYQIARLREAGQIIARAHTLARSLLHPGITTQEINDQLEAFIVAQGARSSLKGYRGFPAATAICVNEEAAHGIPGKRELKSGDLVTVDICLNYRGYHADCAWSYPVETGSSETQRLMQTTEAALWSGIEQAKKGNSTADIAAAVQATAEAAGYAVAAHYGGHGIGRRLHERPFIPMTASTDAGISLEAGMTFTIEPILYSPATHLSLNRWTVTSADGSRTAQFEHTIAITDTGTLVLTAL